LTIALVWGTIRIWAVRGGSSSIGLGNSDIPTNVLEEQDVWGFGQIVPVVLLLLLPIGLLGQYIHIYLENLFKN
jgi:hypothetical protein